MLDLQSHFEFNSSYCYRMHLYIWLMCMLSPLLACISKLCLCRGNMLLHLLLVVATMCLAQALFLIHQRVMALCPWLPMHKALCPCVFHLSRHHFSTSICPIWVSFGVAHVMTLCSWLTKLSPCTKYCALMSPCYFHRLLMRLRCCLRGLSVAWSMSRG